MISGELRHLDPRVFGQHGINLLKAMSFDLSACYMLPLAFGLSLARSPLARLWLGPSWDCLPSLWVRLAFIKQLAMPKSLSCPGPRTLKLGDAADGFVGIKAHRR
jgi:hypothetical protein